MNVSLAAGNSCMFLTFQLFCFVLQAIAPNFTELGFGMTRAPEPLMQDLRDAIRDGLAQGKAGIEGTVEVIDAPENPLFIDRPDLTARVLRELHPYAEAWAGVELIPFTAYGLRLYQNQSAVGFGGTCWFLIKVSDQTNTPHLQPELFCCCPALDACGQKSDPCCLVHSPH